MHKCIHHAASVEEHANTRLSKYLAVLQLPLFLVAAACSAWRMLTRGLQYKSPLLELFGLVSRAEAS
jgi:hypothetical protein